MISNRLWEILVMFKSCKTLSATAEKLYVSQPSLSASVKQLEKELGVQLFTRTKNRIMLNEVGVEAANLAEEYLKQEDFIIRMIQEKARQLSTITVASYTANLRNMFIRKLGQVFPERNVIPLHISSEQLPSGLLQGRFDYIITEYEVDEPNVCCVPYKADRIWIRLCKSDPLMNKSSVTLADLNGSNILLWTNSGFWFSYITKHYGQKIHFLPISNEQEYYNLVNALNIRAFILETTLANSPPDTEGFRYVPFADEASQKTFYLCCLQKNAQHLPLLLE